MQRGYANPNDLIRQFHSTTYVNVLLYNFELNQRGQTLRKTTRENCKPFMENLKNGNGVTHCSN